MVAIVCVWPIIWFNFFGVGDFVIRHVPAGVALNRAHPVFLLGASLLAAFGVRDLLLVGRSVPVWAKAALGFAVSASIAAAVIAYPSYVLRHNADAWLPGATMAVAVPAAFCVLAIWAIGTLASRLALGRVSPTEGRWVSGAVVVVAVLVPPIYGFWGINPVIDRSLFFPDTVRLATIQRVAGSEGVVLAAGSATTPPNILSFDRVATPFLYDAINLHGHFELVKGLGGGTDEFFGVFDVRDIDALRVIGVSTVVRGRQDPWPSELASQAAVVRPGIPCVAETVACVPSTDGGSSAVIATGGPRPDDLVITTPAGLELVTFDDVLAYFPLRTPRSPCSARHACASRTSTGPWGTSPPRRSGLWRVRRSRAGARSTTRRAHRSPSIGPARRTGTAVVTTKSPVGEGGPAWSGFPRASTRAGARPWTAQTPMWSG